VEKRANPYDKDDLDKYHDKLEELKKEKEMKNVLGL
jgi:hypothetical protein